MSFEPDKALGVMHGRENFGLAMGYALPDDPEGHLSCTRIKFHSFENRGCRRSHSACSKISRIDYRVKRGNDGK